MVYYTGLPLLMQQAENNTITQLCFNSTSNDHSRQQEQQQQLDQHQQSQQQQHPSQQRFQQQVVNLSNSNGQSVPYGNFHQATGNGAVSSGLVTQQQTSPVASAKFRCEQCNINFGSKSAHTSHMKSHAKQQQQAIGESKGGTSSKGLMNGQATPADPYQCDVCKKTFAVPARLVRHYRTHTGERPFECEFCHKMFSVKENLQVHRRIHTKERPYKCDICERAFEHSGKLHRHMRIHTGERPHKCSVCGKTFIQSGQLVIHMRTHTGEKPYKCPVEGCGKGFTCSKQLKVHSRTHTGEKPYHCDICFRDFGYNHVLKLHRVQHYGSKCYKCTICDETFKSKKEMEAHIKGHANEIPDEEETETKPTVAAPPASNSSSRSSLEYSSSSSSIAAPDSLSAAEDAMELEEDLHSPKVEFREQLVSGQVSPGGSMPTENIHYYSRFEESVLRSYGVQSGVNPALLAAASIAAAASASSMDQNDIQSNRTPSPPPLAAFSQQHHLMASNVDRLTPPSSQHQQPIDMMVHHHHHHHQQQGHSQFQRQQQSPINTGAFMYEPLAIMKHHGYFAPASQVTEFRSSSDIVRQVEAAIAGTENLLTPPRSSPESPDRSSSPESDSVLMADRDNNTLPPRKRKLYFKNEPQDLQHASPEPAASKDASGSRTPPSPPVIRMSSVIQYAKAS
ncbi:Krueppel homolog 1 isoform X2 [Ochlerotatus camptorhynchus]